MYLCVHTHTHRYESCLACDKWHAISGMSHSYARHDSNIVHVYIYIYIYIYIYVYLYIYIWPAPLCLPLPQPLPVLMIEIDEQAALLPLPLWIRMVMDVFLKPRLR